MKIELGVCSDVAFGKLAGAAKSVVGQWLNGNIKSVHPRYAYNLEENTGYCAKWIMIGTGEKRDICIKTKEGKLAAKIIDNIKEFSVRKKAIRIIIDIAELSGNIKVNLDSTSVDTLKRNSILTED